MDVDLVNSFIEKTNEDLFAAIKDKNVAKAQVAILDKKLQEALATINELTMEVEKLKEKKSKKSSDV